jgi:hypothetical protein
MKGNVPAVNGGSLPAPEAPRPAGPAPLSEAEAFSRFLQGSVLDPSQQQRQTERTETDSGRLERPKVIDLIKGHRDDMVPDEQTPAPMPRSKGLDRSNAHRAGAGLQAQHLAGERGPPPTATQSAVKRRGRSSRSTLQQRRQEMAPLLDLIEALRSRHAGSPAVDGLKIVPPAPNPLRLSLQLWVNGSDVLVQARTSLGPESQEEVRLALLSLEHMLTLRVAPAGRARVLLLA